MANESVLLVSEERMIQWSSLDPNIRFDVLTPSIMNAQQIYIADALGTRFFNRLKDGVKANDLTADESAFLRDYVGPCLIQYALYLLLPILKYKMVEKGILNGTSEETQPTTLQELQYLRESAMETAQFYDERMREFLIQNPNLFVEWLMYDNNGMPRNPQTPYFGGLQTDRGWNTNSNWLYDNDSPFCTPD